MTSREKLLSRIACGAEMGRERYVELPVGSGV